VRSNVVYGATQKRVRLEFHANRRWDGWNTRATQVSHPRDLTQELRVGRFNGESKGKVRLGVLVPDIHESVWGESSQHLDEGMVHLRGRATGIDAATPSHEESIPGEHCTRLSLGRGRSRGGGAADEEADVALGMEGRMKGSNGQTAQGKLLAILHVMGEGGNVVRCKGRNDDRKESRGKAQRTMTAKHRNTGHKSSKLLVPRGVVRVAMRCQHGHHSGPDSGCRLEHLVGLHGVDNSGLAGSAINHCDGAHRDDRRGPTETTNAPRYP
jgi:hypothetical protein